MPRIAIHAIEPKRGSDYPAAVAGPVAERLVRDVGAAGKLEDFVVNHVILPPGTWSSQRHWHVGEDEIVVVLSGDAVLVDDDGRHPMRAGDVAVFRKNDANGHHLRNESGEPCVLLAVSHPEASPVHYPDIGMRWAPGEAMRHGD